MPADAVFIDTWAFLALINGDDSGHADAMALSHRLHAERPPLITTEWVLTEVLGGASRPPFRALAVQGVRRTLGSPFSPGTHNQLFLKVLNAE